ncbi:discoidin domain-containing receptor 2-like [Uloborus diversus]|uniref:discoidin domain-containing receptor 2-like n=1 Tax=Uloborus diversus TaxID=327109 RepID=UPI002409407C|nr:discoidin domain-containing receptor 2-like [Uloborus diversus]
MPLGALRCAQECTGALGMESEVIKNEDINASSSYILASVGPHNARLNKELNGGAWCPKPQISKEVLEHLEISLNSLHVITEVATQGRFGNGQGLEFAEEYMLEYWRPGLSRWLRYRNALGQEVIKGNTNTYTVVKRKLNPIIIASKIRFIPFSVHLRTVCMRVEIYGCPYTDGLLSYSMPQGERRGVEVDLSDMTYDGVKDDSYLHGGLGQLTDGVVGDDSFKHDVSGMGRGYEWVGWKNDSSYSRPVEIIFAFDQVRNFSGAYFYCNNMHTKEVQVFASARIWFSIGGKHFTGPPVNFSYMADIFLERARNVTISLYQKVGRFIKVELMFASKWMLISEVAFNSVPAVGNFTEEEPPAAPPIVSTAMNEDALTNQYVGLVIGVLAAVILLLIIVIFIIIVRNKRRKHTTPHTILKPVDNRVTINMKDLGLNYSQCSPLACQSNGTIYGHQVVLDDSDPDKLLYQEPRDFKIPYPGTYSNESTTSREYAVPDVTKSTTPPPSIHSSSNKPTFPQTLPKPHQKAPSERYYAATDVVKMPNLQGVSGNTVYAVPNVDLLSRDDSPLREIPRHRLHYMEKLGEGQFGEVHLCEAEGIPELVDVPCYGNKTLVAVKTLRKSSSEQARSDFYKEVKILSRLRDPNIVHVLGVCTRDDPLCMVVEYMEHGDLNQFLQQHVPENTMTSPFKSNPNKVLSYGSLIFMATQIASGMKYLESLNFVHRDLATRNCLVGRGYTIKIADFGMSRDLYSGDYYRIEGRAMLPIRWMAWESILLGKFTTKSDVWSFAVTMWEILTFARQQPFADQIDDKVIENVSHFYHNDGLQVYLPQPPACPKEIYDLMKECWQRNEHDRPHFREIHLFLQRKNLGYAPHV